MEEWYKTYTAMQAELQAVSTQEEKESVLREYHNWEWNFPRGIADRTSKELQKARIKTKIDELQEAYDRLNGEDTNNL